jgi:hypothetical protein
VHQRRGRERVPSSDKFGICSFIQNIVYIKNPHEKNKEGAQNLRTLRLKTRKHASSTDESGENTENNQVPASAAPPQLSKPKENNHERNI